jgi:hypothetical protein
MRHEAIYNLYPNVVSVDDGAGAFDAQGNQVTIDEAAVTAEIARLQAEYEAKEYQRQRVTEYPPIGDQLDALWKGGEAAAEMLAKVQAVKTKYPKPE